jgi:hypothetical protein
MLTVICINRSTTMAPVPLKADDLERELNVFPSHRDRQVRGHITASGGDIFTLRE